MQLPFWPLEMLPLWSLPLGTQGKLLNCTQRPRVVARLSSPSRDSLQVPPAQAPSPELWVSPDGTQSAWGRDKLCCPVDSLTCEDCKWRLLSDTIFGALYFQARHSWKTGYQSQAPLTEGIGAGVGWSDKPLPSRLRLAPKCLVTFAPLIQPSLPVLAFLDCWAAPGRWATVPRNAPLESQDPGLSPLFTCPFTCPSLDPSELLFPLACWSSFLLGSLPSTHRFPQSPARHTQAPARPTASSAPV